MRLILGAVALAAGLLATRRPRSCRVVRISRVVVDLDRAEAFYRDGLGFRRLAAGPLDPAAAHALLPGATAQVRRLGLGRQEIELVRWDHPAAPGPAAGRSDDPWFQHIAVVTGDMEAAYARLMEAGPAPISAHGPQALPGPAPVTAFKFRDPDGHPVELIHFPPGQSHAAWQAHGLTLGIDHSAITVADTARSLRFYRRLGLHVTNRTLNHGPAQSALDGLPGARATVTALHLPATAGMGLELLGYDPPAAPVPHWPADAPLADWITLDTGRPRPRALRDPDGHILLLA